MKSLALVGCGFLGGLFTMEMAKRAFAFHEELDLVLVDPDRFEQRNVANQICSPDEVGMNKAEAIAAMVSTYMGWPGVVKEYVSEDNIADILQKPDLIVCAVDNIPTRQLLWKYAVGNDLALLSMGISQGGTGGVEWTKMPYDNNSFSPIRLAGVSDDKLKQMGAVKKLPPCELVGFRGLGFNVALAAAKAYWIWKGYDPELHILGQIEGGLEGRMTSWQATNQGHQLVEAT